MKADVTYLVGYNVTDVNETEDGYVLTFGNGATLALSPDAVPEDQTNEVELLKGKTLVSATSQPSGGELVLQFARMVVKDNATHAGDEFTLTVATDETDLTDSRFDGQERDLSVPEEDEDRLANRAQTPAEAAESSEEE